jgi:UDP-glucose 4-epimerase
MKVLVTGGAGYIGSHFLKELRKNGFVSDDVLVVDNLSNGFEENVVFGNFKKIDLRNFDDVNKVVSEFNPDLIVHFAGVISVPESVDDPLKYYENNFVSSLNLIKSAINNDVKKFIFSSTAAVYGIPEVVPVKESFDLKPINPYGNSKKMIEELLRDVKIAYPDFNYVCLRYFNVAGSDPDLEIGNRQSKALNLIPILLNNLLKDKNEIKVFGHNWNTPDKTCIRDYIHVTDLVKAHIEVIPLLAEKSYVFNVGYGFGKSVLDVINSAEKVTGKKIKRIFVNKRKGDPEKLIADNSKIIALTNWKPKFDDLNLIVKNMWDWMNNEK